MFGMIASVLLVLSFSVNAEEKKERSQETLEQVKIRLIRNFDKRIAQHEEIKICVKAAMDLSALQKCRQKNKEQLDALLKEFEESQKKYEP